MITIDDKLDLFRKAVLQKVIDKYDEKLLALNEEHKKALEEFELTVHEKKEAFILRMEDKAHDESRRMISKAKSQSKSKVLYTRQTLIEELLESVKDRIHLFVESEIYTMFLKDNLKSTLEKFHEFDCIVVELTQHDHQCYGDIIEESLHKAGYRSKQIKLVSTDEDIIGGFIVYDGDRSVRIDFSLAAVIRDNKRFMGKLVYDIISEAGDAHAKQR